MLIEERVVVQDLILEQKQVLTFPRVCGLWCQLPDEAKDEKSLYTGFTQGQI
jgi:hypothetical protein